MQVRGRYEIYVTGLDGTEVLRHTGTNLLTENGAYDWIRKPLGRYLALGEGTQPETPQVQELNQYVQSAQGTYVADRVATYDPDTGYVTSVVRLEVLYPYQGTARNFTELGIHDNQHTRLQTYALLRGLGGLPYVLTVVAGERVRVLYEISFRVQATKEYSQVINGVQTKVTQVCTALDASNSRRLPGTSVQVVYSPTGIPEPLQPISGTAQGSAKYTDTSTVTNFTTAQGNSANGIQVLALGSSYQLAWHFDPPIKKSSDWRFEFEYSQKLRGYNV